MVREMPTKSEFLRETRHMLLDIKILKSPECGKTKIKFKRSAVAIAPDITNWPAAGTGCSCPPHSQHPCCFWRIKRHRAWCRHEGRRRRVYW